MGSASLYLCQWDAGPVTPGALLHILWAQAHCGADALVPRLESLVFNSIQYLKIKQEKDPTFCFSLLEMNP